MTIGNVIMILQDVKVNVFINRISLFRYRSATRREIERVMLSVQVINVRVDRNLLAVLLMVLCRLKRSVLCDTGSSMVYCLISKYLKINIRQSSSTQILRAASVLCLSESTRNRVSLQSSNRAHLAGLTIVISRTHVSNNA